MKYLLIFLLLSTMSKSKTDILVDWSKAKSWRLYASQEFDVFDYSLDTLRKIQSIPLNDDSVRLFMRDAKEIADKDSPLWMGLYLLTCELPSGEVRKVEVSRYGRFFYDEKEKKYYNVQAQLSQDWRLYINSNFLKLYK